MVCSKLEMLGEVVLFYNSDTVEKEWVRQNSKAEAVLAAREIAIQAEETKRLVRENWQKGDAPKPKLKTEEQKERARQAAQQSIASIKDPQAKKGVCAYCYAMLCFTCAAICLRQIISEDVENTDVRESFYLFIYKGVDLETDLYISSAFK
jgi:hypothetical protein